MPVTLDQIAGFLDKAGTKFSRNAEQDAIEIPIPLRRYRNGTGDNSILVIVTVAPGGQAVAVRVPVLYTVPEGPTALPTLKALILASREAEYVKFVADPEDNSVEVIGSMPVANARLTPEQLNLFLSDFPAVIEYFHPMIQRAIDTGEVIEPDPEEQKIDAILEEIDGLEAEDLAWLREALDELANQAANSVEEEL